MTDETTKRQRALEELRSRLQARVLASTPSLGDVTGDQVWRGIKRSLLEAYDDEKLKNPSHEIHQFVPKPSRATKNDDKVVIRGGLVDAKKPFKREPEQACLERTDGAWLHFTLTLRCSPTTQLVEELWAYDFEIVFPDESRPSFLRFDLNPPGHENDHREIRSHMHPANAELLLPAPVMAPDEILDIFLRRLYPRDPEHPRS